MFEAFFVLSITDAEHCEYDRDISFSNPNDKAGHRQIAQYIMD